MKRIMTVIAAAVALIAAPAFAQDFSGPRVGVEVGVVGDDFASTDKGTYGAELGYDFDLGNVVVGPQVAATSLFSPEGTGYRELSVGARVGVKVTSSTLAYVAGSYSNIDAKGLPGELDGAKVGVGIEQNLTDHLYAGIETRYGNYQSGVELYSTAIRLGYRF